MWNISVWMFGAKPTKFIENDKADQNAIVIQGKSTIANQKPHRFVENKPKLVMILKADKIIITYNDGVNIIGYIIIYIPISRKKIAGKIIPIGRFFSIFILFVIK